MHHSDPQLDATSAARFHPGEIFLSGIARLVVVPLLGMTLPQLIAYEAVLFPIIVLHHSNVRLPRWLDRGLLALIVTPAMHRVHHSRWRPETDSNFGSVFPHWDRLFRSFRLRADARTVALGLDEFAEPRWQTVTGMLATPFSDRKRSDEIREGTATGGKITLFGKWLQSVAVLLGLAPSAPRIAPTDLEATLRSDRRPVVIDIRSPEAFASGHVPGAINVAIGELPAVARGLTADTPVVLYCNFGFKSRRAAGMLKKHGIDARDLVGGMRAWTGPVER